MGLVCHAVNHLAVIHLRICDRLKRRCSISCQANIQSPYIQPTVLCFLEVEMNYLQTRLCELKRSLGAPVFGFQWTILPFVVVSTLFTVSLIFQTSPRVAREVCVSWRRLKFKLFSLNIAVSVWSKPVQKGKEPSLFVCLFLCSTLLNISISEHLASSCHCHVWGLKRAKEVCVDLRDHGNRYSPSHKS